LGLSEHEQRMLDELEKGLRDQDAKFAQRVSAGRTSSAVKIVSGVMVMVAGISTLVLAAVIHWIPIGLMGFVLMLAGLLIATAATPGKVSGTKPTSPSKPKPNPSGSSITDFFEKRWDNRGPRG